MPTDREVLIKECTDKISIFANNINILSKLNLNDAAVIAENNMLDVINYVFDMDFSDLNEEINNAPGIDYIDKTKKTGMQVTMDASYKKIKHSIDVISKSNEEINAIWFLFLINKPYTPINKIHNGIRIEPITLSDVIIKIKNFPLPKLNHVFSLLKELSINSHSDLIVITQSPKIPKNSHKFHNIIELWLKKEYSKINPNFHYQIDYNDLHLFLIKFIKSLQKIAKPMREVIAEIIILSHQDPSKLHTTEKVRVQIENLHFSLSNYHNENLDHYFNYLTEINILHIEKEFKGFDESNSNGWEACLKYNNFIAVSYPSYDMDIDMFCAIKYYFNAIDCEQKIRDAIVFLDFTLLEK